MHHNNTDEAKVVSVLPVFYVQNTTNELKTIEQIFKKGTFTVFINTTNPLRQ